MISRYHIICFLLILFFAVAGCSRLDSEKPTPTSLATLEIAAETRVPSPTTAATLTPPPTTTRTDIPSPVPTSTELPSPTSPAQPTLTPHPTVTFQNDRWQQIEISPEISGGLDNNWLAFINYNDRARALSTAATPEPASLEQTLYLVNPVNHRRVEVADIPVSAGNRVYWSPAGNHAAYFVQPDFDENGEQIGGLYMLDLEVGLQYRLFDIPNLNPRGIAGNEPAWSADGSRLAVVLPTEYATDIFIMNADGTNFRNLTNSGSYELWHAFSPDGLWLAFVSDRDTCPTWTPDEPGSCAQPDAAPPTQGKLYIMNLNTGEVRKITDVLLNGAPEWITPTELSFSTGGGSALAEESTVWLIDIEAGTAVQVSPPDSFSISPEWTDDASRVVYQRNGTISELVLADNVGRELVTSTEYIFPRFGMAADWSPGGEYLAIGGRNGQCPYGILVVNPDFEIVTLPGQNLLVCDPIYAPEGRYLAFMAIRPSTVTDGRLDIYFANLNGLGATNITSDMQGQMEMLGWVGPTPENNPQ